MDATQFDTAKIYASFETLERLRIRAKEHNSAAAQDVVKQFEKLFVQLVAQNTREAAKCDDQHSVSSHDNVRFYNQVLNQQLANKLRHDQDLRLAEALAQQQDRLPAAHSLTIADEVPMTAEINKSIMAENRVYESPMDFVQSLWPAAKSCAEQLGVDPKLLIAQAALETGWGKSILRANDGASSNNIFNIKANHEWKGDKVVVKSLEYIDGLAAKITDGFRRYDTIDDSFADYAAFIQNQPRYHEALQHADKPEKFIQELHEAGYASDPNYADKVLNIYNGELLNQTISTLEG